MGTDGTTKSYPTAEVASLKVSEHERSYGRSTGAAIHGNQPARLALRKKYYDLVTKILPTTVVARFLQLENQIDLIVDLQIASNLPIIEEAPPKQ